MTAVKVFGIAAGAGVLGSAAFLFYAFGAFLPWREAGEAEAIVRLARIEPGMTVAEIGAGTGRFSRAFARRVGPSGHVYATELSPEAVARLGTSASAEGLRNYTEVRGTPTATHVPEGCCDVVFLRNVYHHVTEPASFASALRRLLKPGGRLVVVDFDEGALWFHGGRPGDAGPRRRGHGVARTAAIGEIEAAGFRLDKTIPDWRRPMWVSIFSSR